MAKRTAAKRQTTEKPVAASSVLTGWQAIADFLGEPVSVVERWAKEGMPVHRETRRVTSSPEELNSWMEKVSGKPVHVATETADLSQELKRGLKFVQQEKAEESASSPTYAGRNPSEGSARIKQ